MKFTSEDLLKAMGLKVGDNLDINGSKNYEIICDHRRILVKGKFRKKIRVFDICNLVDHDYEIIQPKPTLTEDEKTKLQSLDKKWKFIARDQWEDNIMVCDAMPHRNLSLKQSRGALYNGEGEWLVLKGGSYEQLREFNHLFQFIKWEDEPYSIEELLEEN